MFLFDPGERDLKTCLKLEATFPRFRCIQCTNEYDMSLFSPIDRSLSPKTEHRDTSATLVKQTKQARPGFEKLNSSIVVNFVEM